VAVMEQAISAFRKNGKDDLRVNFLQLR
jgi:hypothetical protein